MSVTKQPSLVFSLYILLSNLLTETSRDWLWLIVVDYVTRNHNQVNSSAQVKNFSSPEKASRNSILTQISRALVTDILSQSSIKDRFTHIMPCPCRVAKGLEYVFPIWFTQCGRVWFTLAMPRPCHAPTMPFFSRPQHGRRQRAVLFCGLEKNGMAWAWHGKCESDTVALCKSNGKRHILNP